VPLSDAALAALKAHRHLKGPYVFCEADGARLTHSAVKDVVPWTCLKAGLAKRLTTHDLRHYPACRIIPRRPRRSGLACLGEHRTRDN